VKGTKKQTTQPNSVLKDNYPFPLANHLTI